VEQRLGLQYNQIGYNECLRTYNGLFFGLPGGKAIVVGLNRNGNSWRAQCFWSWNSANSGVAARRALDNCRREYSKCALYGTGEGRYNRRLSAWTQSISNNRGRDPDAPRYSNGGGASALTGSFLRSFSQIYNSQRSNSYRPRYTTPSPAQNYGGCGSDRECLK
jgi:hypothetical protein